MFKSITFILHSFDEFVAFEQNYNNELNFGVVDGFSKIWYVWFVGSNFSFQDESGPLNSPDLSKIS